MALKSGAGDGERQRVIRYKGDSHRPIQQKGHPKMALKFGAGDGNRTHISTLAKSKNHFDGLCCFLILVEKSKISKIPVCWILTNLDPDWTPLWTPTFYITYSFKTTKKPGYVPYH
jgi:hypothetical protein